MKMHKNCCHQSCSFWLRYMHQIVCRLGLCPRPTPTGGAYIAPPDPLAGLGVGPTGNGKEGGEGKRTEGREETGREGVPECPNPELASLDVCHGSSLGDRVSYRSEVSGCSGGFGAIVYNQMTYDWRNAQKAT